MSRTHAAPTSAGPVGSGARRRLLPLTAVLALMLGLAAVVLVADQGTKEWALASLDELEPEPLLGRVLQLTLLFNSGAAWGMGSGITPVVTCVQIAIAVGVVVWAVRSVRTAGYAVALGLVLGGALGNIHDRLLRPPGPFRGEVVDFLQLPYWPVFNVADIAVVAGALLIILLGVLGRPVGDERERPAAPGAER